MKARSGHFLFLLTGALLSGGAVIADTVASESLDGDAAQSIESAVGLSESFDLPPLGDGIPALGSSYEASNSATTDTQGAPPACPACANDGKKKKALKKKVASAYKVVNWNNDFSYLFDPNYNDWHLGEELKRRCFGDCYVYDVGGAYRLRYQSENNMRPLGLTGNDDDFDLHQTRLYANVEAGERFRFYAEYIDAVSFNENTPPRAIDENRSDLLNLFGDMLLLSGSRGDLSVRVGRQELINSQQRLVSPLPWGNTRRTFEGAKFMWTGTDWDAEAFWTNPVQKNTTQFDKPNDSQEFSGLFMTYKDLENESLDVFYYRYIETEGARFQFNTIGGRYAGETGSWLWEAWGAGQWGNVGAASQSAWAYTIGLGRKFPCLPWTPTLWAYFDFATGDNNGNGFHHLFPLGHKYLGFMDFFGRRNIEDTNFLLTLHPRKRLKFLLWWHIFHLQNSNDVPYNVNLTPFVATPGGDPFLGQELDLLASYDITPRTNLIAGYSHFFAGPWYATNPSPAPFAGDADFVYIQFRQRF